MSTVNGGPPNIVTNNLTLYLDAANRISYVSGSTTWIDLSAGKNNGTLTNGPTFDTGNGGSIVFDGSNDRVISPINPAYTQGTISCWIFPKATNNNFFVYTANDPISAYTHQLGITTSGTLNAYMFDGGAKQFTGSIVTLNTWHNVALYWIDGNSYGSYLNGSFQGSGSLGTAWKSGTNFFIGANTGGPATANGSLNGNISNFQIYNRALSASEIIQNYNATKARFGL